MYSVRKKINCSGETEILHELVHDTARISSWFLGQVYVQKSRTYTVASAPAGTGSVFVRSFSLIFAQPY